MDRAVIEAVSEYREAFEAHMRLRREVDECKERLAMLQREEGAAQVRRQDARAALLEAVIPGGSEPAARQCSL